MKENKISESVGLRLASLLSLAEKEGDQLITFPYNYSKPKHPEPVFNFRCELVGKWRMIQLLDMYEQEVGFRMFCEILKLFFQKTDLAARTTRLKHLYEVVGFQEGDPYKCSVPAKNFEEGVEVLFNKLTEQKPLKLKGVKKLFVPSVIIQCTDEKNHLYKGFIYIPEEKIFKNLSYLDEFHDHIKVFLNAEYQLLAK